MDIDYDILANKLAEALIKLSAPKKEKKLTGRSYWANIRKQKYELKQNEIPLESAYDFHKNCDSCDKAKAILRGE